MKKITFVFVGLLLILNITGCSITSNEAKLIPYHDKVSMNKFYVVENSKDKENVASIISKNLQDKGYQATSGNEGSVPNDVDVIVTYEDRWMWDMSMYMIQLNIELRNSKNEFPIVAGETIRTSLSRKTPEEMVAETLIIMFEKLNQGK
ncbi:MAG: hypothetical protein WBG65_03920 [Sulfurimonadaceae bacterium]